MRLLAVTLAFAVLSLGFAPAPFPKAERSRASPPSGMQGLWEGPHELRVTATQMIYHPNHEPRQRAVYARRVDRGARPSAYDLALHPSSTATFRGIYKVEGDTLTLCYDGGGRPRPASFAGGAHTEVYKRVKR